MNTAWRNHLWLFRLGRCSFSSSIFGLTNPIENSPAIGQQSHMDGTDQGLDVNPNAQQFPESFTCDGLEGGIDALSFPGVHIREQAETPQQGSRGDQGIMGTGQGTPVPIIPGSLPLTTTQVDAIGANSPIR